MPDEKDTTMDDYLAQMEQHEFIKRQGIEAYAEMILGVLGDKIDEDKKILIKQGLTEMMAGPPRLLPWPAQLTPSAEIDAEFISPIFEEDIGGGTTRIWDWECIAAGSTHCQHAPNRVTLFFFDYLLITLQDEAAESFWKWLSQRGRIGSPRLIRRRHGQNSRPNPRRSKV
jgi:hypothetical protein